MLFNLGLTANAAAAHENDFVGSSQPPSQPSNSSSKPSSSSPLSSLPSLPGLGSVYGRYKSMEQPVSQGRSLRDMTRSPVESVVSSDGDRLPAGTGFRVSSRMGRSQSVKKGSARPKTIYQLAHPASRACHRRFRIRPKLLLQLQQVSQIPRPLPILDVLPSTVFLPRLARKFPTIFRGKDGLGPNDLIIVASDLYEQAGVDQAVGSEHDDDEEEHQEVVATICQLLTDEALSKGKAEICLNQGPVWEATPLPNGSYEFAAQTSQGVQILRWVLRGAKNRRTSAPIGSPVQTESKRFTFSVINPNTRRHPVLATMTRNHLEVFDEYSIPATVSSSLPTSAMSMVSDGSDDISSDRITLDKELRILIIITSIWVGFREGWSHNFRYNDSALALNSKIINSPITSRHTSPTTIKNGPDYFSEENQHPEAQAPNGRKHRVSMSNAPASSSDRVRALASEKLVRRSNSTGAAFIERSNRRSASGSKGRGQRHSVLPTSNETGRSRLSEGSSRQVTPNGYDRRPDKEGVKFVAPDQAPEKPHRKVSPVARQPEASASREPNGHNKESNGPKTKRRHRLSGFFECLFRKSGTH